MEVTGSYTFNAPAARVWEAFMDPGVLAKCLPGVDSLRAVGTDSYQATVTIGVGPVRGSYDARVSLLDQDPPRSYRMRMEGNGPLGFANGDALVNLEETDGVTVVTVTGDAQVGGPVARVGQRMMGSVAQGTLDRMMSCLRESLQESL